MKKVLSIVFNELINDNRVMNEARSLSRNGYSVTILAALKHSDLPVKEEIDGVRIIRVPVLYDERRPIYRIKYLRYFFHHLYLIRKYQQIASEEYDFIHCHDLDTLEYGVTSKLFGKKKVVLVYDSHEYQTQRNGVHGLQKLAAKIKERLLITFCDRVITVSNSIAEEYVRLYSIEKPYVILNCPALVSGIENTKYDLFRDKFDIPSTSKIFLYQGYLYPGRGIEIVLEAFEQLKLKNAALVFMGGGPLLEVIQNSGRFNKEIFAHPFVSGEALLKHTASADFGISFIEDISLSDRYCLPNKLFEYIGAGLPVISSGLPELKKFIEGYQVGSSSDSNDVEGFLKAFDQLLKLDLSVVKENVQKARLLFNWGTQEKLLLELYEKLEAEIVVD